MHEKCITLSFKIVVFSVMGLCSLNGRNRRFGLDLLFSTTEGLRGQTKNAPPSIHNHICIRLYGVLTQTTL